MDEFALTPTDEVWNNVAARLTSQKKKRRLLIYLLFPTLLFVGLGGWYVLDNNKYDKPLIVQTPNKANKGANVDASIDADSNTTTKQPLSKNNVSKSRNNNLPVTIRKDKTTAGSDLRKVTSTTKLQPGRATVSKDVIKDQAGLKTFTNEQNSEEKPPLKDVVSERASTEKVLEQKSDENERALNNSSETIKGGEKIKEQNEKILPFDTTKNTKAAANVTVPLIDTATLASLKTDAKPTVNLPKRKKVSIGFVAFAGSSNNVSGLPIFTSATREAFLSDPRASSSAGTANNSANFSSGLSVLRYNKSLSYGFGFNIIKQLDQRFSFTAGLNYHYYSATTSVGNKIITSGNFYDSVLDKSSETNEYYQAGSANKYKNKYQLLELPLNMQLQMNKNKDKPFTVSAGLSLGYLIGSNALYANYSRRVYYTEKEQFKRLQLLGQAGLQFTVIGSKRYNITLGPAIKYGITNMGKPATQTQQHLFTLGLQTHVNLK
jgi:hypothetical protein